MVTRSRTRRFPMPAGTVTLLLLLATGCDWLLGPLDEQDLRVGAGWNAAAIAEGPIHALDLTLDAQGRPAASYITEQGVVRISRLIADGWTHLDGPSIQLPSAGSMTRLVSTQEDNLWVLYPSGDQMYLAAVGQSIAEGIALDTVPAEVSGGYARPAAWMTESAAMAWGSNDLLRVALRSRETPSRLWLFRFNGQSWTLESIPNSLNITGTPQLAIGPGAVEHLVYAAGGEGRYLWWRPHQGWQQRLPIPGSNPFLLALRSDHSSVIGTRDLHTVKVALEHYDDTSSRYYWDARSAVTDDYLYWHNLDLALDHDGLPSVLYISGPLRREDYQVWLTRMSPAGTWQQEMVAGELRLPTFHPAHVRMVRDTGDRVHVLLPSGESSSSPGGSAGHVHRLMHYTRANMEK